MSLSIDSSAPTEAAVVAELADLATSTEATEFHAVRLYQGEPVDLRAFADEPQRLRGTTALHDGPSFVEIVKQHDQGRTRIYADGYDLNFIAVFNDVDRTYIPGWCDHRATYVLRRSPEWLLWERADLEHGGMMDQEQFAEHIELCADDIVEPTAASMLELAQTFHAKKGVNFRSANILANGEQQFTYEEDLQATAGTGGKLEVPREFKLALRPFDNGEKYAVTARLRFRLTGSKLSLGYKLVRPDVVTRDAFDLLAGHIATESEVEVFRGNPPTGI